MRVLCRSSITDETVLQLMQHRQQKSFAGLLVANLISSYLTQPAVSRIPYDPEETLLTSPLYRLAEDSETPGYCDAPHPGNVYNRAWHLIPLGQHCREYRSVGPVHNDSYAAFVLKQAWTTTHRSRRYMLPLKWESCVQKKRARSGNTILNNVMMARVDDKRRRKGEVGCLSFSSCYYFSGSLVAIEYSQPAILNDRFNTLP